MTGTLFPNVRLVDGTGAPWQRRDVRVRDGVVTAVSAPGTERADPQDEVVDCDGLVLCPGFVDLLTHSTWTLPRDGRSLSKVHQGVTSEVMGEGYSPAPCRDGSPAIPVTAHRLVDAEWLHRRRRWVSFGDWLRDLVDHGVSTNVGGYLGGGTLRALCCADARRPALPGELAEMQSVVADALDDGALGVAYALIYEPDLHADRAELTAVAESLAARGGILALHIRSETGALLEAIEEVVDVCSATGVPAEVFHLKAAGRGNWHLRARAHDLISAARAGGVDITADVYPYGACATGLSSLLPADVLDVLDTPAELVTGPGRRRALRRWDDAHLPPGTECEPDDVRVEGRPLTAIVDEHGDADWRETVLRLLASGRDPYCTFFDMDAAGVAETLGQPWASVASDGAGLAPEWAAPIGPEHPRDYGTFARVIGPMVREGRVPTLEQAVSKCSWLPARRLGLIDRGLVLPGFAADLVLLDPVTITDRASYDDPHQLAAGVRDVWVNGAPVLRAGEHTGALPGEILRRLRAGAEQVEHA